MAVLWYAVGIYMIGIALVLYLRPRIMFRDDGMWKEFGLSANQEKQTIFPFWMFALVWAILSYALANILSMFFASVVLNSSDTTNASFIKPISTNPNVQVAQAAQAAQVAQAAQAAQVAQVAQAAQAAQAAQVAQTAQAPIYNVANASKAPGYYILDPYANPSHPRYIYYGPNPPGSL